MISTELLFSMATLILGGMGTILKILWERVAVLDKTNDDLLQKQGEIRAENAQLRSDVQRLTVDNAQLRSDLERVNQDRKSDQAAHARDIQRLRDENIILRRTLRAHNISVDPLPTGG